MLNPHVLRAKNWGQFLNRFFTDLDFSGFFRIIHYLFMLIIFVNLSSTTSRMLQIWDPLWRSFAPKEGPFGPYFGPLFGPYFCIPFRIPEPVTRPKKGPILDPCFAPK